jgi:hypothetical protein
MYESVIDRIESLERSVRRWRTTAIVLAVLLLSILTTGTGFFTLTHLRARQAMLAEREAAMAARAEAEAALQAARAREEAARKKE